MSYEIITDLTESRLIPTKGVLRKYTAEDISNLTFLYLLSLEILFSEFDTSPEAMLYASNTIRYGNFDTFRFGTNDLYIFLHILTGKNNEHTLKSLGGEFEDNKVYVDSLNINVMYLRRHLMLMKKNQHNVGLRRRFLIKMQKDLRIGEAAYRHMRVLIAEWESNNRQRKAIVMTRLLMAFRHRALRADILPTLKTLGKKEKLILKTSKNPETGENMDNEQNEPYAKYKDKPKSQIPWWIKAAGLAGAGYGSYKLARSLKN